MSSIESSSIKVALDAKAYPYTRRYLVGLLGLIARFLYPPKIEGLERLPLEGPYFICGNHMSMFDILLIHPILPVYPHWLAKIELFRMPVIKEFVRRLGAIPVDRDKSGIASIKTVRQALKQNKIIGVFPQGTRVKEEALAKVLPKKGMVSLLARGGLPIFPVCIVGPYRLFRRTRMVFGAPFCLNIAPGKRLEGEAAKTFSQELMHQIYQTASLDKLAPSDEARAQALASLYEGTC